jgi:hypothetical protein
VLPDGVDRLAIPELRVAGGSVAVEFTRSAAGVRTEVLRATGVEVEVP